MVRSIYLVRHGQYSFDKNDPLEGGLTQLGREQARCTADFFRQYEIEAIHCSTMRRAVETARIIADEFAGIPFIETSLLWECVPTIPPRFAEYFAQRANEKQDFSPENIEKQRLRADEAFEQYFTPSIDQPITEIIVCHGNLMRYLVTRALDIDAHKWSQMHINHCGMTHIQIVDDGTMDLISHNETGHLPVESRTA